MATAEHVAVDLDVDGLRAAVDAPDRHVVESVATGEVTGLPGSRRRRVSLNTFGIFGPRLPM
jgi:hypothetical protein